MPVTPNYADLEVRIGKPDAQGYPVEITLNHDQLLGRDGEYLFAQALLR